MSASQVTRAFNKVGLKLRPAAADAALQHLTAEAQRRGGDARPADLLDELATVVKSKHKQAAGSFVEADQVRGASVAIAGGVSELEEKQLLMAAAGVVTSAMTDDAAAGGGASSRGASSSSSAALSTALAASAQALDKTFVQFVDAFDLERFDFNVTHNAFLKSTAPRSTLGSAADKAKALVDRYLVVEQKVKRSDTFAANK